MQMTNEEICRHYQQAANKSKDIGILADLNATNKDTIREILAEAGLIPMKQLRQNTSRADRAALRAAIEARLESPGTDKEISEELGCTSETVRKYRHIKEHGPIEPKRPPQKKPKRAPGPPPYDRVEGILGNIPVASDRAERSCAFNLCMEIFRRYIADRLELDT